MEQIIEGQLRWFGRAVKMDEQRTARNGFETISFKKRKKRTSEKNLDRKCKCRSRNIHVSKKECVAQGGNVTTQLH